MLKYLKKIFVVILAGCAFVSVQKPFCIGEQQPDGPVAFLSLAKQKMEEYHKKYGSYAKTIKQLESLSENSEEFNKNKGKDYRYTIIEATKYSYHIISENNKGLDDYEITGDMEYPMKIFKTRGKEFRDKNVLLKKMRSGTLSEKKKTIYDFKYFTDEDTKFFLIGIIKDANEDKSVRDGASDVLYGIIKDSDSMFLPDLLMILKLKPSAGTYAELNIIRILEKIKDPAALPALKKITSEKRAGSGKSYDDKVIAAAEQAIKAIEDAKKSMKRRY